MKVVINGETKNFNDEKTLQSIIEELKVADKVMAIAVNMEIVKKEKWNEFVPKEGDRIEMLNFVAGG
ncbi:sulfur carrier protein ThiS [Nitrosophilus alvini]|uniref:sulfur carrier protein ThiS n=1 Tax=Nitrosophilus alvini TaxID=2714855 RepID=UPI00190CAE93|nr:sulfur carrier protein ThiS [Nitrosophilus alvini]